MEEMNYWKIKEFSERVNDLHIRKFPDDSKIHQNSIDKWFKDLEEQGIHYVQRSSVRKDWKIYDELDLNIAIFIMEMRSKSKGVGWNVSAIYNIVPKECEVRPFPQDYENLTPVIEMEQIVGELKNEIINHLETVIQTSDRNRQLLLEESFTKNEMKTKEVMIELFERQSNLKKEAAEEWEKMPDEKRFIKKLFRKEENWKERERFIEEYVEKNMWKELAKDKHIEKG